MDCGSNRGAFPVRCRSSLHLLHTANSLSVLGYKADCSSVLVTALRPQSCSSCLAMLCSFPFTHVAQECMQSLDICKFLGALLCQQVHPQASSEQLLSLNNLCHTTSSTSSLSYQLLQNSCTSHHHTHVSCT